VPSSWILTRGEGHSRRYRVLYRIGGRESSHRYAGSFKTKKEALARQRWVDGELAAMRIPNLELLDEPVHLVTLATVAEQWRQSRIDVAEGTSATHSVNLGRILPQLRAKPVDRVAVADVAAFVAKLHEDGLARESIRKTRATLAMVLDFAGREPNPARDRSVKLPREDRAEIVPPTAAHVHAILGALPRIYRLAAIVLEATGMRVGELEALTWGDVDEPAGRWRVSAAASKTRQPRWVPVPADVFDAVVELVPREDRDLDSQVFDGFGADRFRTALTRACKATGTPAFSPHDLRHRRATLWHLQGIPVAEAAAWLGHSPTEHLRTYAHAALTDRSELDYTAMLEDGRTVRPSVRT
jgi:integrase